MKECSFKECPDSAPTEIIDDNGNGGTAMTAQTFLHIFNDYIHMMQVETQKEASPQKKWEPVKLVLI